MLRNTDSPARGLRMGVVVMLALIAAGWSSPAAQAFTPESPEVQALVTKGLKYLENQNDARLGAKCLRALCWIKYHKLLDQPDQAKNHPAVLEAVKLCGEAKIAFAEFDNTMGISNYSLGIAIMLLCEADPVQNQQVIEKYVAELLRRQKPAGGWGYERMPTCDTSQTQYAVLGMWMAQKMARVQIPIEAQESCTAWLMRTQSRNGGYGYQGKDPGTLQPVDQDGVTLSLSAAGSSSLFIMADLLQVTDSASSQKERPGPFKFIEAKVEPGTEKKGPLTKTLDPAVIRRFMASGEGWFRGNYKIEAIMWQHYYMYALERYESFRDLAAGKWTDEPRWYNDGVRLLQKTQAADGSWPTPNDTPMVSTCFAILFLLRSTQQVIVDRVALGDGTQLGGFGLPPNVANLREEGGKLVDTDISGEINQVLDLLAKGNDPQLLRLLEDSKQVKLDGEITKRQSQIETLRKFVSAGEPTVRQIAIRTLGRIRGLEHVPQLLYALTDPEVEVVIEADKALRFVSRKTDGVGLKHEPEKLTREQIKAAQLAWKAWYLSVKPDAELLD